MRNEIFSVKNKLNHKGAILICLWLLSLNSKTIGAELLIDVQVAYQYNEQLEFVVGVDNLLDTYPEENPSAGGSGQLYPESAPFGFNGGTWYLQARYNY